MPFKFPCPVCKARLTAKESHIGRTLNCPKCSSPITVPQPAAGESPPGVLPNSSDADAWPPGVVSSQEQTTTERPVIQVSAQLNATPQEAEQLPVIQAEVRKVAKANVETVAVPDDVPPPDTSGFPNITLGETGQRESTSAIRRNVQRAPNHVKVKKPIPLAVWYGGGIAITVICIVALVLVLNSDDAATAPTAANSPPPSNSPSQNISPTKSGDATLVLDWPSDQRTNGAVEIDGKRKTLPTQGQVSFSIQPGSRKVRLFRRGYEPIELLVSFAAGQTVHHVPEWQEVRFQNSAVASTNAGDPGHPGAAQGAAALRVDGYPQWLQILDAAKTQARAQNKDLLIAFVCSDADEESVLLRRDVFQHASFYDLVDQRFVCVVLDFPRSQSAYSRIAAPSQNQQLRDSFGVDYLPTIVLTDPNGLPYQELIGYERSQLGDHLTYLQTAISLRKHRDQLLARAASGDPAEQLAAAVETTLWLQQQGLVSAYADRFSHWVTLAQQIDPRNENHQYEVVYEVDWLMRLLKVRHSPAQMQQIVMEFSKWKESCAIHDQDRGARMHLIAASFLLQANQQELAARFVDDGAVFKPEDEDLREKMNELVGVLKGELGLERDSSLRRGRMC